MHIGEIVDTPESRCPACGCRLDAATCLGQDASPSPGDVSICYTCCTWLVYDGNLRSQLASGELLAQIRADLHCRLAEHALRMHKAERN
jgi:hypothetical protein